MKTLNEQEVVGQQEVSEPEMDVEGREQESNNETPETELSEEERKVREHREYMELMEESGRQWQEQRFVDGEGGRLSRELYEKYQELAAYIAGNGLVRNQAGCTLTVEMNFYRRLRENLEKARQAERCGKRMQNGRQCGCPRMKDSEYCYAHTRLEAARPEALGFPALDGPLGLQESISLGLRALLEGKIDLKMAGMIGYYLQLALWNAGRLEYGESPESP